MNVHPNNVKTDLLAGDPEFAQRLSRVLGLPQDDVAAVERRAREVLPEFRSIVWEGDPTTFQFTYVGGCAEQILGYPVDQWRTGDFWTDTIVLPEDRTAAVTYCALATGNGRDHDFSYRARTVDGRVVRLHDVVQVIKGPRQIAVRLRGVMVEIPESEPGMEAGPSPAAPTWFRPG